MFYRDLTSFPPSHNVFPFPFNKEKSLAVTIIYKYCSPAAYSASSVVSTQCLWLSVFSFLTEVPFLHSILPFSF